MSVLTALTARYEEDSSGERQKPSIHAETHGQTASEIKRNVNSRVPDLVHLVALVQDVGRGDQLPLVGAGVAGASRPRGGGREGAAGSSCSTGSSAAKWPSGRQSLSVAGVR